MFKRRPSQGQIPELPDKPVFDKSPTKKPQAQIPETPTTPEKSLSEQTNEAIDRIVARSDEKKRLEKLEEEQRKAKLEEAEAARRKQQEIDNARALEEAAKRAEEQKAEEQKARRDAFTNPNTTNITKYLETYLANLAITAQEKIELRKECRDWAIELFDDLNSKMSPPVEQVLKDATLETMLGHEYKTHKLNDSEKKIFTRDFSIAQSNKHNLEDSIEKARINLLTNRELARQQIAQKAEAEALKSKLIEFLDTEDTRISQNKSIFFSKAKTEEKQGALRRAKTELETLKTHETIETKFKQILNNQAIVGARNKLDPLSWFGSKTKSHLEGFAERNHIQIKKKR